MDNMDVVMQYMSDYGNIFLFVIVYLEYLNLPGLPAGIIMPAAGLLIARSDMHFLYAIVISVVAGLLGSYTLYGIGYFIGKPALDKVYNKYPKVQSAIDKSIHYVDAYGNKGVFISRLIPVARTLISLVAGTVRMKMRTFTFYSTVGITVWNLAFILSGYLIGMIGK